MIQMHIFLVGMAGAGKTSLGRRLAQNMSWRFVDTDQRACEMLGVQTVNEAFASLGEPLFRAAETGALIELVGQPPCVVSTGGELCTFAENVTIMKNHGVIIHIDRPLDQIISDIKVDRRPLLAGGTHEDVIEQYNRCIGHYRAAADYRLDNSKGMVVGLKALTELVEGIQ
ncbi:MAG: shikimate kinase [Clostridia bacterium]|nr:shikimate kinase [Clostridia bacterium]